MSDEVSLVKLLDVLFDDYYVHGLEDATAGKACEVDCPLETEKEKLLKRISELEQESQRLRPFQEVLARHRFKFITQKHSGGLTMEERAILEVLDAIADEAAPWYLKLPQIIGTDHA